MWSLSSHLYLRNNFLNWPKIRKCTAFPKCYIVLIWPLCIIISFYRAETIKKANGVHFPEEVVQLASFMLSFPVYTSLFYIEIDFLISNLLPLTYEHRRWSRGFANGLFNYRWHWITCTLTTYFIAMSRSVALFSFLITICWIRSVSIHLVC